MKKVLAILFFVCWHLPDGISQVDSFTYDKEDAVYDEENHQDPDKIYVEETPYGSFFLQDSVKSNYSSKVEFKNDLRKEYKRLASQYEVGPKKKAKEYNFGWLERLLDLFPGINLKLVIVIARILIYALIGLIFFFILKYFFYKDINWNPFKKGKPSIVKSDSEEGDLSVEDFENRIQTALAAGNKRIAIRYYYLWLLQKLNAYQHIKFHPEKTNSDYLYELTNVKYRASFANLSYIYDYTWYGEAELSDKDFAKVKENFDHTIRQIY